MRFGKGQKRMDELARHLKYKSQHLDPFEGKKRDTELCQPCLPKPPGGPGSFLANTIVTTPRSLLKRHTTGHLRTAAQRGSEV